ncbi:MAG: hypothetical protein J6T52_02605 [Bacteroidaceae bacterium]|nr:hypothetical protein [Bacteroidaceae bacterium]
MKNKSLTPNPSPKGEGSRMKNGKLKMKNVEPLARQSNYSSFLILHSSFLLVIVTLFLTIGLRPEYLIETADLNPFYLNEGFFRICMSRSGSLVVWVSCGLASWMVKPWLGAVAFGIALLILMVLMIRVFRLKGGWQALAFVPSMMAILNYTQLGYMIYVLKAPAPVFSLPIGLIVSVLLVWAKKAYPKTWWKWTYLVLLTVIGYPLFGFYALLALLLCILDNWRDWAFNLMAIILGISVPLLYFNFVYSSMQGSQIYLYPLPDYFWQGNEWKLWIPVLIAIATVVICAICSPSPLPSSPRGGECHPDGIASHSTPHTSRSTPHASRSSLPLGGAGGGLLHSSLILALSVLVFLLSGKDKNFHNILKMSQAVDSGDWQAVVDVARNSEVPPTRAEVLFRNLALQQLGTSSETMFKFEDSDAEYTSARKHQYLRLMAARQLYYYYGKVNYSYRWCMEDMVEYGLRPTYLQYMTKCALMNGETDLARKYLTELKDAPFREDFVEKYSAYIDHPQKMEEDTEMQGIKRLMNYNNLLDGDAGLIEVYLLNSFALTEGGSREMVELSLQCNMILKDINGFWARFLALLPTFGDHIPLHYQEAAVLFSALENKYDISKLPIDQNVKERFMKLVQESEMNSSRGDEANAQLLKPSFGDTYWYYYFFVKGLKTN